MPVLQYPQLRSQDFSVTGFPPKLPPHLTPLPSTGGGGIQIKFFWGRGIWDQCIVRGWDFEPLPLFLVTRAVEHISFTGQLTMFAVYLKVPLKCLFLWFLVWTLKIKSCVYNRYNTVHLLSKLLEVKWCLIAKIVHENSKMPAVHHRNWSWGSHNL